jgi:hypothetical protein
LNFQSVALHGGEMRAPRNERDLGAGLRQRRTEATSDAAGADNCNPHEVFLTGWKVGWISEA